MEDHISAKVLREYLSELGRQTKKEVKKAHGNRDQDYIDGYERGAITALVAVRTYINMQKEGAEHIQMSIKGPLCDKCKTKITRKAKIKRNLEALKNE